MVKSESDNVKELKEKTVSFINYILESKLSQLLETGSNLD